MDLKNLAKRLAQRHDPPLDPPSSYWDDGTKPCPECSSDMVEGDGKLECPTCGKIIHTDPDYEKEKPDYDSPQVKNKEFGGVDW